MDTLFFVFSKNCAVLHWASQLGHWFYSTQPVISEPEKTPFVQTILTVRFRRLVAGWVAPHFWGLFKGSRR